MDILYTLLDILNEMSPYILLGLLIAGILHAFVPSRLMSRHLSGHGFGSAFKAAMIGVPLPLCSCGVLPTAVAMRRSGASKAATTSFLIATPQTGVDSITATYSLLGPAFALVRPVAALVTALGGGWIMGRLTKGETAAAPANPATGDVEDERPVTFAGKLKATFVYGFNTLLRSIGKWLVAGLVIAALITIFVPSDFLVALGDRPLLAMLAMLVISVPMYVCATGSIPIAMSLMLKGLSPGAGLVLLMAGPAANFASIAVISRTMGRRTAALYVAAISLGAIAFGLLIDYLLPRSLFLPDGTAFAECCHHELPLFSTICSGILLVLLAVAFFPGPRRGPEVSEAEGVTTYRIKGMTCPHCRNSVERNLSGLPGVENVYVNLSDGTATVTGSHDRDAALSLIREIGFEPVI